MVESRRWRRIRGIAALVLFTVFVFADFMGYGLPGHWVEAVFWGAGIAAVIAAWIVSLRIAGPAARWGVVPALGLVGCALILTGRKALLVASSPTSFAALGIVLLWIGVAVFVYSWRRVRRKEMGEAQEPPRSQPPGASA